MRASLLIASLIIASTSVQAAPLPAKIPIALDKGRAEEYFARAASSFRKDFDHDTLRAITEQLSHGEKLGDKAVDDLKAMRKTGAILRSLFVSLGKEHNAPKGIATLIVKFGKLNDAVEGQVKKAIPQHARALLPLLDAKKLEVVDKELSEFQPAGHESLARFFEQTLAGLSRDNDAATVEAKRFHEIRKELKHLMNLFGLIAEHTGKDAPVALAYDHLMNINDQLGQVHDDLVHRSMRGELDYAHAKVPIPDEARKAIRDLRAALVIE